VLQNICILIRNSNCHEPHAVKNKMDTGRREHFSVSHITSLLANIQFGWLKGIYMRLKISVYSRQRAYTQIKNRYVILM